MSESNFFVCNKTDTDTPELLFYSEIREEYDGDAPVSERFAQTLKALNGKPLSIRINSAGGDVFLANNLYAQLRSYKGKITVYIDGLAASAATLLAMAGDEIIMPANALMMIHNPTIAVREYVTADELKVYATSLEQIKEAIIQAYLTRCALSRAELSTFMNEETWFTANECVAYGFADRISGRAEMSLTGDILHIAACAYDLGRFKNAGGLRAVVQAEREVSVVTKLEAILNKLGLLTECDGEVDTAQAVDAASVAVVDVDKEREAAILAERERIAGLEALHDGSARVTALIAHAKRCGDSVEKAKGYIDALKAVKEPVEVMLADMVEDNKASGVDNVVPTPMGVDINEKEAVISHMANIFSNKGKGE